MERVDVLQLVRENRDKYKQHLQKMKELEERDKQLNYQNMYKDYSKKNMDRLITISEGGSETISNRKIEYLNDNNKRPSTQFIQSGEKNSQKENNYIYNKIYDSNDEEENEKEIQLDHNYEDNKLNSSNEIKDRKFSKSDVSEEDEEKFMKETKRKKIKMADDKPKENIDGLEAKGKNKSNDYKDEREYGGKRSVSYDEIEEYNERDCSQDEYKENEEYDNSDYNYKIDHIYDHAEPSDEEKVKPHAQMQSNPINRGYLNLPSPRFLKTNTKGVNLTRSNNSLKNGTMNKDTKKSLKPNQSQNFYTDKRPYTALTYSTIKKMKSNTDKTIKKPSIFENKIIKKKYNGKSDRVALYQLHKTYWDKKPYLANKTIKLEEEEKCNSQKRKQLQKLNNLTKPIRYYTKI